MSTSMLLMPQARLLLSRTTAESRVFVSRSAFPVALHPTRLPLAPSFRNGARAYSSDTSSAATTTAAKLSKFKQYAEQFKNKPASHLIAFGILHEVTAVVPLPIVYFILAESGMTIPFPEKAMEEGNQYVSRVAKYFGWDIEGTTGARTMLNMATSYALVKVSGYALAAGVVHVDDTVDSNAYHFASSEYLAPVQKMKERKERHSLDH
ncbi:hypothetical protein EDD11_000605 [Mortierella claussenii]|nr:hypothetical protein EDD11_000605 [Mortierella claussenii]